MNALKYAQILILFFLPLAPWRNLPDHILHLPDASVKRHCRSPATSSPRCPVPLGAKCHWQRILCLLKSLLEQENVADRKAGFPMDCCALPL